jgi:hypothetical protein
MPLNILDAHHPGVDVDLMSDFIELADTDNILLELGDVVDAKERTMLPIHAAKDDGAATLDPHHQPISKLEGVADTGVDLGEGTTSSHHVIDGSGVDDR